MVNFTSPVIKTLMAFIPLIWLLVSLGRIRLEAWRACVVAMVMTWLIAGTVFDMHPVPMLQASLEGIAVAVFPIIWVIISALFVYNITVETGAIVHIKNMLSKISPDRRIQALILAFSFGGFLEAAAGFGTAVAIPAGIMAAMGFNPLMAAIVCLIANTIPVAFGVLGIPVITLAQVTSLSLSTLSLYTAVQLIPFVILLPVVLITIVTGSIRNLKGVTGICMASGLSFAAGQTSAAILVGPELAAVAGALLSLITALIWLKIRPVKEPWLFKGEVIHKAQEAQEIHKAQEAQEIHKAQEAQELHKAQEAQEANAAKIQVLAAWSPYIIILVLIFATRFLPFLKFLNEYPFLIKKQFYFGEDGKAVVFQFASGSGTLLFISALVGGLIQGASFKKIIGVLLKTLKQSSKTIITVLSIVILAKVMGYSGMSGTAASALTRVSRGIYPLFSPLIGALGTFLTGSDTSSNILFGNLQKQAAIQLNINREWLVAANASGATAGKMISPQSISIATTATGLSGSEGKILGTTVKYCIVYAVVMGLIVYIAAYLKI